MYNHLCIKLLFGLKDISFILNKNTVIHNPPIDTYSAL